MGDIAVTGEVRLGAVLEKSGAIFGGRIVPIILVTFVAQIPNDLAQFLAATAGPDDRLALTVLSGVVGTATGGLSTGAVMYGVIQELRGRRFSARESFSGVLGRLGPVVGISVFMGVIAVLTALLPGNHPETARGAGGDHGRDARDDLIAWG